MGDKEIDAEEYYRLRKIEFSNDLLKIKKNTY